MSYDYQINLRGDLAKRALEGATSVDTLANAIKATDRTLKTLQVNSAKAFAAGDQERVKKYRAQLAETAEAGRRLRDAVAGRLPKQEKPKFFEALAASRGPIGGLLKDLSALKGALKDNPMAALAVGATAAGVAVVSLGSKMLSLAKSAALFSLNAADSARSARILNDAADIAGGGQVQLTQVINQLTSRVPLAREQLAEMGREYRKLRFSGREAQLALSATAIATSALGDTGGSAIKGLAETSKTMRRFYLGARNIYGEYESLRSTGLTKADVFGALAEQLGTGAGNVEQMLHRGQITVRQGLQGVDAALSKKFGGTVSKQLLSVETQFAKMREDFMGLFSGAEMEPFLKSLRSVTSIFSDTTVSGRAFKSIVTGILNDLGKLADAYAPKIRAFLLDMGSEAAKPGGFADAIKGWIADARDFASTLKDIADAVKAIVGFGKDVKAAYKFVVRDKAVDVATGITGVSDAQSQKASADATRAGVALPLGIAKGIDIGKPEAVSAMLRLSQDLQKAFKVDNEIRSPAGKYKTPGRMIPAGVAVGVDAESPRAEASIRRMSERMQDTMSVPSAATRGGGGREGPLIGQIVFNGVDRDVEQQVRNGVTMALREAMLGGASA